MRLTPLKDFALFHFNVEANVKARLSAWFDTPHPELVCTDV
jgi:hypothetical protein